MSYEQGWTDGYSQALEDFHRWNEKVKAMPKSTQSPDHELQPAEPALDLLEPPPMTLRERLLRFLERDRWTPYTGADE